MPRLTTAVLGVGHAVFTVAWCTPLHGPTLPGRVSVATSIASYGPVWSVGFGITAVLLLLAAVTRRRVLGRYGHGLGAVVTMAYAGASLASALLSDPVGSVLTGVAFLVIAAVHLLAQRSYGTVTSA